MGDIPCLFVHKSALHFNTDLYRTHNKIKKLYMYMAQHIHKISDWICSKINLYVVILGMYYLVLSSRYAQKVDRPDIISISIHTLY